MTTEESDKAEPLAAMARAFERGDYCEVRRLGAAVAESAEDEAIRERARAWVDRTRPDPLVRYLLLLTFILLVGVTIFAYSSEVP